MQPAARAHAGRLPCPAPPGCPALRDPRPARHVLVQAVRALQEQVGERAEIVDGGAIALQDRGRGGVSLRSAGMEAAA